MSASSIDTSSSTTTLADLLLQMYTFQEALDGWDAVMNVQQEAVNTFFADQWKKQTGNTNKLTVSTIWCQGVNPVRGGGYSSDVTQTDFELGPPEFQFEDAQDYITVTQHILSGTTKSGTLTVPESFVPTKCGCPPNDGSVLWGQPATINVGQNPTISGKVPLSYVQGLVGADAHSLVLDFSQGAFTANNLTITGVDNTTFVDQLKNWFQANKIQYILASLNYANLSGQPALTPSSFKFNVKTTNAGVKLVQLLITTNGTQPPTTNILVEEPIPITDGYTCSLMVNSRILYQDILIDGFNKAGKPFNLASSTMGAHTAYYAYITPEIVFKGSFSFGSCCDKTTVTYSIPLGGTYKGSQTDGFQLYQTENTVGNVHVNITVNGNNPVGLSGSGTGQEITITPGTPSVSVTGSAEGEIKSTLQAILNSDFKGAMSGISFKSVSLLALESLLFPSNLIKMSAVQVPGDLLIVGTFEPTA